MSPNKPTGSRQPTNAEEQRHVDQDAQSHTEARDGRSRHGGCPGGRHIRGSSGGLCRAEGGPHQRRRLRDVQRPGRKRRRGLRARRRRQLDRSRPLRHGGHRQRELRGHRQRPRAGYVRRRGGSQQPGGARRRRSTAAVRDERREQHHLGVQGEAAPPQAGGRPAVGPSRRKAGERDGEQRPRLRAEQRREERQPLRPQRRRDRQLHDRHQAEDHGIHRVGTRAPAGTSGVHPPAEQRAGLRVRPGLLRPQRRAPRGDRALRAAEAAGPADQ